MSRKTAVARVAAVGGALAALLLLAPVTAQADSGCIGTGRPAPVDGSSDQSLPASDVCHGSAQFGAGLIYGVAAVLVATGVVLTFRRGKLAAPEEFGGALVTAGAVPPAPASAGPRPVAGHSAGVLISDQSQQPAAAGPGQASGGNGSCRTAADGVDVVSGQLLRRVTDVRLHGLLPLVLRRAYASGYEHGRLFGAGWSSTLDQRVEIDPLEIRYFGDDAQVLTYPRPRQPGQLVLPVDGARLPLVWDADGVVRVHDMLAGTTWHFPVDTNAPQQGTMQTRWLGALTDRNGGTISYHRAGYRPIGVEHAGGYRVAVDTIDTPAGPRVSALRLLTDEAASGAASSVEAPSSGPDQQVTVAVRVAGGTAAVPGLLRGFGYDARGRLTTVTDADGVSFGYEYGDTDRIVAWVDQLGHRYEYEYDDRGRVTRANGPDGALSAAFGHDTTGRVTTVTDAVGQTTAYHYDHYQHLTRTVDPLGHTTWTEFDRYGHLLSSTDQLGHVTRITRDGWGDATRVDHPDGTSTHVAYTALRQRAQVTDENGSTWRYTYDERGNTLSETDPLGAVTAFGYDQRGHLVSVTDPLGATRRFENNAAGLRTLDVDALGNQTRLSYDPHGNLVGVTDPLGHHTALRRNAAGRIIERTNADGTTERWRYDAAGNETEYQNSNGARRSAEYGPFRQRLAYTGLDGARHEFAYDAELRLSSVTGPTGLVARYQRDAAGRLVAETDVNDHETSYQLDAAGRLTRRTNGTGQHVDYQRDARGRVTEARTDTDVLTTFTYTARGELRGARNPDATLEYEHDALGRVLAETINGRRVAHEYDAAGRPVRRVTPTGVVSAWRYGARGEPTELATPLGAISFDHDASGQLTAIRLSGTAALTRLFGAVGQIAAQGVWALHANGPHSATLRRSYAYRPDGLPREIREASGALTRYELDAAGRPTAVDAPGWSERYAYDALGNLTEATWPATIPTTTATITATTEPGPDATEPTESAQPTETADDPASGAREYSGTLLLAAGQTRYEYDARGRVTRQTLPTPSGRSQQWQYSWDADDRLTQAISPDGHTWRYRYDPLGRRIAKQRLGDDGTIIEQTTFAWDGDQLVEQVRFAPDGSPWATSWDYEPGTRRPLTQYSHGRPDASAGGGGARCHVLVTDPAGTPTELVDGTGQIVGSWSRGAWGVTLRADGVACPLRFPGQYADDETGLHYDRHRYYDPRTARYLTPDPRGLTPSANSYAYASNPLVDSDRTERRAMG